MGSGISENKHSLGRVVKMAWLTILAAMGIALAAPAMAIADSAQFNIEAQPLPQALKEFAAQAHMQLLYEYGAVAHAKGNAVIGDLDKRAALEQLLKNSGLEAVYSSDTAVTIRKVGAPSSKPQSQNRNQSQDSQPGSRLQLAQATPGQAEGAASVDSQQKQTHTSEIPIQEVIVTAQKREQRLQDVPVPVTAISGDTLVATNQLRLEDYSSSVPSLNMTLNYNGAPTTTIRGLSTGSGTNPTVAIVVDDVPFGSSTALGGGFYAPDIDPSELARVEVLRGPQGTLYGANSLGGLIHFVTVDPSTGAFNGRLQGGTNAVFNGAQLGYNLRGSVNVPVTSDFAIRASAYTRDDPGYIDDPTLGLNGVNKTQASGGRLAGLWEVSPDVTVRFSALLQETKVFGSSDTDLLTGLGDLQQTAPRGAGERDMKFESYRVSVTTHLGFMDLTSISGYSIARDTGSTDISVDFGPFAQQYFGVSGSTLNDYINTNKFTEEVRLSGSGSTTTDWLAGAFYTHERSQYNQGPLAVDPASGAVAGSLDTVATPTTYAEYALFGDFTYHFTNQWSLQLGARESQNRQNYSTEWTGPLVLPFFGVPSPLVPPPVATTENSFTYLVTPQFKLTPDIMVYARLASGFRPGGPNEESSLNKLPTYGPDRTLNYELGTKSDFLDHALSVDASIYYIDWRDIQIQLVDPVTQAAYYVNASRAKSQGAELSVIVRPAQGLTFTAWAAWDQAVLTQNFPQNTLNYGSAGDRLPYSSRFSANASVEQRFPLTENAVGFVGGALSYVGGREGNFQISPTPRAYFPPYARLDLRGGVLYKAWSVNVYANNIADRRGVITGGVDNITPYSVDYIQPRTIGVNLIYSF